MYNTTGQHYRGHFSIWTTNQIQEYRLTLSDMFSPNPPVHTWAQGWVNGNFYVPTSETLGVLPIPDDIRSLSGMAPYVPTVDKDQHHQYLAMRQGTRKPILPVHTNVEQELFHSLQQHNPLFAPCTGEPDWQEAVKVWNSYADRLDNVYYKVHISGSQLIT